MLLEMTNKKQTKRGITIVRILCKVKYIAVKLLLCLGLSMFFMLGTLPYLFAYAPQVDLSAVAHIESSGNPLAFNSRTKATGLYQITPICFQDFVKFAPKSLSKGINFDGMLDPSKNEIVASWYLSERIPSMLTHFGYEVSTRNVLISYNCGVGCLKRDNLPLETKEYLKKYQRLTNPLH